MRLDMIQNSRFGWRLEIQTDGRPVDISGAKAFMQVRSLSGSALMSDLSNYASVSEIEQGVIEIEAPASATADLDERIQARYDVALEFPDGDIWRVLNGVVHVIGAVTEVSSEL